MKLPSVFVLGDSISIGYGPYLEEYLKGRLTYFRKVGDKQAMQNIGLPPGANGRDSFQVLQYVAGNHVHHEIPHVDRLLFNCGLHDIKTNPQTKKRQVEAKDYSDNLQKIVDGLRKLSKHIVWIRSTPVDDKIHNSLNQEFYRFNKDLLFYNDLADQVMQRNNIPTIDLYAFTHQLGSDVYADHVHFTDEVRKKQAKYIAEYLRNVLLPG